MIKYFFDTYSMVEFINANKNYKKYFTKVNGVTSRMNLMELYYSTLLDLGKEKAEKAYNSFLPFVVEPDDLTIKKAMLFRFKHKKQRISYVDAVGYQLSIDLGLKFLTGDKEFKEMKNVEFVK